MHEGEHLIRLSARKFVGACAAAAVCIGALGRSIALPPVMLAVELAATILALFYFGSSRYRLGKNGLTYGAGLVILATFSALDTSQFHRAVAAKGWAAFALEDLLSFRGLDSLIHADTMLFILGLTMFVAVIGQTRILESFTFVILRRHRGEIAPTIIEVVGLVALLSGILDGVSMIGLTIRTLVLILFVGSASIETVRYAVMICTIVTTVCGMWLAYGEPPNLIMKANLDPHLTDVFFLKYCAPAAIASYLVISWNLKRRLSGKRVDLNNLDLLVRNMAPLRFAQATRHGEMLDPLEVLEISRGQLGQRTDALLERVKRGESFVAALIREEVPEDLRIEILEHFAGEKLARDLDRYYCLRAVHSGRQDGEIEAQAARIQRGLAEASKGMRWAQLWVAVGMLPFAALLVLHGVYHERVPLFFAGFAGYMVASVGLFRHRRLWLASLRDARREYSEYLFLLPLFFSISLLSKTDLLAEAQRLLAGGLAASNASFLASVQFAICTFLSALLDNNVVADLTSRTIRDFPPAVLQLFAMAQIAGYALGGCWTHIGSAQSVVAYAFIEREVDKRFTPWQWIREMTLVIAELAVMLFAVIYIVGSFMRG